jgi:hypothetical protein
MILAGEFLIKAQQFKLANKAYVQQAVSSVASGLKPHAQVYVIVNTPLNAIYDNGPGNDGIGATLTNNGDMEAFVGDGVSVPLNARVVVNDQVNPAHNGIFDLTVTGSGPIISPTAWVLTRSPDFDQNGTDNDTISQGAYVAVQFGDTYGGSSWVQQLPGPFTVGTTPIKFVLFNSVNVVAGAGLQRTGNVYSVSDALQSANLMSTGFAVRTDSTTFTPRTLTGTSGQIDVTNGDGIAGDPTFSLPNVGSGVGTSGSASQSAVITTDAQGRVSTRTQIAIEIPIAKVTSLQGALDAKLDLAGGTMAGPLILNANPSTALGAATKQYVDSTVGGTAFFTATTVTPNVENNINLTSPYYNYYEITGSPTDEIVVNFTVAINASNAYAGMPITFFNNTDRVVAFYDYDGDDLLPRLIQPYEEFTFYILSVATSEGVWINNTDNVTPVVRGGLGISGVSEGDIPYGVGNDEYALLPKDTNATRALTNTGPGNRVAWAQINLTNGVTGTLPVGNGGTGVTSFTNRGAVYGTSTGITSTSAMTDGVMLMGETGSNPFLGTISGSGVSFTAGVGYEITGTTGNLPTVEITSGGPVVLNANTRYIMNAATLVQGELTPTFANSDRIEIVGVGAGGWRVSPATGDTVIVGTGTTATGATGTISSTNRYDCGFFSGVTADTSWSFSVMKGQVIYNTTVFMEGEVMPLATVPVQSNAINSPVFGNVASLNSKGLLYGQGTGTVTATSGGTQGELCTVNSAGTPVFSPTIEGDIVFESNTTTPRIISIYNNSEVSTGAHAILALLTSNTGGGDPFIRFTIDTVGTVASYGMDNSDGDAVKLSFASTVGTTDAVVTDTNRMTTFVCSSTSTGTVKLQNQNNATNDTWWAGFSHGTNRADSNDRARIGVTVKSGGAGELFFTTGTAGSQTERMRIDQSGRILIGATASADTGCGFQITQNNTLNATVISESFANQNTQTYHFIWKNPGQQAGSISTTNNSTSYATSSDRRAKKDFETYEYQGQIDQLVVTKFRWKNNEVEDVGLIAQELYAVIPEAVSKGDNDTNKQPGDEGFEMWGVDYSRIVPYLVAANQELKKLVLSLNEKVMILENQKTA